MAADLQELLIEWSPQKIVIEVPSGKVGAKHGGGGAGLTTYGFAVGAVWQACRNATVWANVHTVDESTWTRRVPKKKRQLLIAAQFPQYGAVVDIDKGGDVSDAIGIGLWWLTEEKLTWAVSTALNGGNQFLERKRNR